MIEISVLLIPISILCSGIVVLSCFDFIKGLYNEWYSHLRNKVKEQIEVSIYFKIKEEVDRRFLDLSKEIPNENQKEIFQKLAGIK
jgi:hypothetical protein